jgi:hypothetical protein
MRWSLRQKRARSAHRVRLFLLVAALAVAIVGAALAARLDPSSMVLSEGDLPSGFHSNREHTGVWSNHSFADGRAALERLVARSGRITGYSVVFDKSTSDGLLRTVRSRTDLCRRAAGADKLLAWLEMAQKTQSGQSVRLGNPAYGRTRLKVGSEGWVYWRRGSPAYTIVGWRQGRIVAFVEGWGIPRAQVIRVARVQEQRIRHALRAG